MANASRKGIYAVGISHQKSPNTREYLIPDTNATDTFIGDAVKSHDHASVASIKSCVVQSGAGNALRGVLAGLVPRVAALDKNYRPASTAVLARVYDDPTTIFEAQEDGVGGALAEADIGLNVDITVGTGSTTTGASATELDTSTKQTTATLQFKILGFVDKPDNESATASAKVLVKINNHEMGSHTGTAGV